MSVRTRIGAIVVAGALGALAVAIPLSPADAGPSPSTHVRIKISKHADGPFKETARLNIDVGKAKSAYLKVRSLTGNDEGAFLIDTNVVSNIVQRYFTKNGTEITSDVTGGGGGYLFSAKGDKPKLFRVKVHRNGGGHRCWSIAVQDDAEGDFDNVRLNINGPDSQCFP